MFGLFGIVTLNLDFEGSPPKLKTSFKSVHIGTFSV
jgi:hypothetical protein